MLSQAEFEEVLQMQQECVLLRAELKFAAAQYWGFKAGFRGNQPRWPEGMPGTPKPGGRWSGGPGTGAPASGSYPAGRNPGGHHFVPRVIFEKENLKPETRKVFEEGATGPLRGQIHGGGEGHNMYTQAVREALDRFKIENQIASDSSDMTPEQAKKFLDEVKQSKDPRIRNFNFRIYMREVQYYLRRISRRID